MPEGQSLTDETRLEANKSAPTQCRLKLKLKTNAEGLWIVDLDSPHNKYMFHEPPLAKTTRYYRKLRTVQRLYVAEFGDTLLESRQSVSANKVEDDGLDMYKDDFDQEFQANPKQQSFEEIFMMQQAAP